MNNYNFSLDLETKNTLSIFVERITPNSKVLEFGPANGRMTKHLKENLNCKVYAVELDEVSAKDSRKFCEKIIIDDVENYSWVDEYKNIEFDYIVFADVLEHLHFPEKVLNTSKSLLKDKGSIFISVPNIAHNAIIMELLQDKFTYRSTGILDNTHIKFFTKNTLDELIKKCDLNIAYETAIYISPEKTEFGYYYNSIDNNFGSVLSNRKYGEIYQFIVEAKKVNTDFIIDFSRMEESTLYFDTGNGFNENQMERTTFHYQKDSSIIFNLASPIDNVKTLRIDPVENTLNIKINQIFINNVEIIEDIHFNGKSSENQKIIFSHRQTKNTINRQRC